MQSFEDYVSDIFAAYRETPILVLERKLTKGNCTMKPLELIKLIISLKQIWDKHKKLNVQCGILVQENTQGDRNNPILSNDFDKDLSDIIQSKDSSILYIIDNEAYLIGKQPLEECLKYDNFCHVSSTTCSVAFYLGLNGIDTLINGEPFETVNRFDSYKDIINIMNLDSISDYKKLLKGFFEKEVQYDPLERYFVQTKHIPKHIHSTLNQYPKLLDVKPEARFQRELIQYLKKHCIDKVLPEVKNEHNERYDVWIVTHDDKVYILEIKWLGTSLTSGGNVFCEYDKPERALDGAYQLKDYIDNADKYAREFRVSEIYCGVLVVFDARETMDDICFPGEFKKYPQIDLSQHFKIYKEKPQANKAYHELKKKA